MRSGGNMSALYQSASRSASIKQFQPAGFHHAPAVEPDDRGGDAAKLAGVMADIDHRHVGLVAQAHEIGQDLALAGGVERGERLIEDEEARAHQQRAADRDALALAAGQLAGAAIEQMADIEQIDDAPPCSASSRGRPDMRRP